MTTSSVHDAGFIFVAPEAYANPDLWHAAAALLRRADPVHRVEAEGFEPFYAVTRHAHIVEIERQHDKFWNTQNAVLGQTAAVERLRQSSADIKTLIHMDGAEHRAHRRITNDWFKPANLRQTLAAAIDRLARKFVDRMAELGDECDFASDVALYYPLHVIMSVLGVPESDEPRMLQLTQKLFGSEDPDFGGADPEQALLAALMDFAGYFNAMTADRAPGRRRTSPRPSPTRRSRASRSATSNRSATT
jgi:cytochrome P450